MESSGGNISNGKDKLYDKTYESQQYKIKIDMPLLQENVIIIWHNERILMWLDKKASLTITSVPLFYNQKIQNS
jgi:hypothetical protein